MSRKKLSAIVVGALAVGAVLMELLESVLKVLGPVDVPADSVVAAITRVLGIG